MTYKRVAAAVAVLIFAVGVGLVIRRAVHPRPTTGDSPPGGRTTTSTTAPAVEVVPGPGQAFVTGTITSLVADNAIGPPLTPPFTITIPSRGQGSADITGVTVGGKDVEVFWYGGQPLPVSGTGQLAMDGAALSVDASGITWMLDGAPRSLTSGQFHLGAPVAVGSSGLAQPYQNISFQAGDSATVETTGHARVQLPLSSLHVTGPGSVTIQGRLELQTATGGHAVQSVVFGPGSYDIGLSPMPTGEAIRATLQGPYTTG